MISLSHALKYAAGMLMLILCVPLSGLAQQSPSSSMGKAPQTTGVSTLKVLKGGAVVSSRVPDAQIRETVQALVAEMTANQDNAQYDMQSSLRILQNSPYVVYPLDHFDASFPVIWRTGDVNQDKVIAKEALAAWESNQ